MPKRVRPRRPAGELDLSGPDDDLVPADMCLIPDPGSRLLAGGTVLVGGSPARVLRLTASGARQVADWWRGAPVSDNPKARTLARRLLDTGIAHPVLNDLVSAGRQAHPGEVTVVIPVRDRHAELVRCLAGLKQLPDVIVVDDCSADSAAIASAAAAAGARVLRRRVNGGPGAARNTGLAAAGAPFVAFLDSDCVPRPGWLDPLLPHFTDPAVGAVAPRIVPHEDGRSWLARYEGASSTLDMGARASVVRPGSRVPYVPGAALVVRKAAAGSGFAEDMLVGEDVDFVWRLAAAGWRVRYEPAATMPHQHRVRLRAWFSRRKDYGTSAAALESRHPGAVRPIAASGWTALAWLAAVAGRPAAGAVVAGSGTALLARRLAQVTGEGWPLPVSSTAWRLAVRLAGGGTVAAARPLGSAISRTWWPVAAPAAVAVRRLRLPLAALVLAPPLFDWLDRRPPLDPARYVGARLLDDLGYSLGVWQGCAQRRTIRPLLPLLKSRGLATVMSAGGASEAGGGCALDGHPDRIRWNARYAESFVPCFEPHPLAVLALAMDLPDGPVADLACGTSGSALLAAARGRKVTAVDVAEIALGILGGEARRRGLDRLITLVHADLSAWRAPSRSQALVLCTGFWDAAVFAAATGMVAAGGLLGWEAFTAAALRSRPSLRPAWCLAPGEPGSLLPADFTVLDQRDLPDHERGVRRQMLARRAAIPAAHAMNVATARR